MSDIAIRVEHLSKRYRLGERQPYKTLREALSRAAAVPFGWVKGKMKATGDPGFLWALNDVSFEVKQGEALGIIGRNGAGKSTLLKILSRITKPTKGRAEIYGRVGSLLEVGTGFHPELTGRENIYLNGAILGMKRKEIERKFDEIVAFAEIEKFLDTPVKRYSSGMYVRLAFAVAAHLEPEILFVDEVLSVGDTIFQKKCTGKMEDVAKLGKTVLFVSHNMSAIQNLCDSTLVLSDGGLLAIGPTPEMIDLYLTETNNLIKMNLTERNDRYGSGEARFQHFMMKHGNTGIQSDYTYSGAQVEFEIQYLVLKPVRKPVFWIAIYDLFGTQMVNLNTYMRGCVPTELSHSGSISCKIPRLPLLPGQYHLEIALTAESDKYIDRVDNACTINVEAGNFYGTGDIQSARYGKFLIDHSWEMHRILT